jgi:diaminopimelate epimerase
MSKLAFTKMQGCGNDYIFVVADRMRPVDPAGLARCLSDRHFGVGADGLILLTPSAVADIGMEMYNADGSRGEMCGNGIRCLARLAHERGLARKNPLAVETDAGIRAVTLHLTGGVPSLATVDMGEPILEGRRIPAGADGPIIDYPLKLEGRTVSITAVSMGNPHCVTFVDDDSVFTLSDSAFAELGQQIEHHPFFPRRVNAEFVRVAAPDRLKVRVWERGSGETMACGSGACATLVAAVLTERAERRAKVELRGGQVEIEWPANSLGKGHVFLTGDAVEVFNGEVEVDGLEPVNDAA